MTTTAPTPAPAPPHESPGPRAAGWAAVIEGAPPRRGPVPRNRHRDPRHPPRPQGRSSSAARTTSTPAPRGASAAMLGTPVAHPTVPSADGRYSFPINSTTAAVLQPVAQRRDVRPGLPRSRSCTPARSAVRRNTCGPSTATAYENLPEQLRNLAESLRAVHSNDYGYAALRPDAKYRNRSPASRRVRQDQVPDRAPRQSASTPRPVSARCSSATSCCSGSGPHRARLPRPAGAVPAARRAPREHRPLAVARRRRRHLGQPRHPALRRRRLRRPRAFQLARSLSAGRAESASTAVRHAPVPGVGARPEHGIASGASTAATGTPTTCPDGRRVSPAAPRPHDVVVILTDSAAVGHDRRARRTHRTDATVRPDRPRRHPHRAGDHAQPGLRACRVRRCSGPTADRAGVHRNGLPLRRPAHARGLVRGGRVRDRLHRQVASGRSPERPGPVPRRRGRLPGVARVEALEFTSDAYRTVLYDTSDRPVRLPGYRSDALIDAQRSGSSPTTATAPLLLFVSLIERTPERRPTLSRAGQPAPHTSRAWLAAARPRGAQPLHAPQGAPTAPGRIPGPDQAGD